MKNLWTNIRGDLSSKSGALSARHHGGRGRSGGGGGVVVGTQAKALDNIRHNAKHFHYPKEGFATPIEHSLLYSMISEPKIYPEDVVVSHIEEEDFSIYLHVNDNDKNQNNSWMGRDSYAQLSALLVLSAENFPPKDNNNKNKNQSSTNNNNNRTRNRPTLDELEDEQRTYQNQQQQQQDDNIPKSLCKKIMLCVVQYAEQNNLDRKAELTELLRPVEQYASNKSGKTLLPMYMAYAVGIFIPGGVGLGLTMLSLSAILATSDRVNREATNVNNMTNESNRISDVEKTGLLEEAEDM